MPDSQDSEEGRANWPRYAIRYDPRLALTPPLSANVYCYAKTGTTGWDLHAGLEVGIVLVGVEERIFPGTARSVFPGEVWLTGAWEPHDCRILEPDTQALHLLFMPEFLGEATLAGIPWYLLFAVPPDHRPRVRSPEARRQVWSIAEEVQREMQEAALGWKEAVRYDTLRLLLLLRRDWQSPGSGRSERAAPPNDLMRLLPALTALHAGSQARV